MPSPPTKRELRLLSRMATLESMLVERSALASAAGITFGGERDVFAALGYKTSLTVEDYFTRFRRNGVARRLVRAYPDATWRGVAGELFEDPDPAVVTPFEAAWFELSDRLKCWSVFRRADVLAGLGEFAVVLIGAAGDTERPLTSLKANSDKDPGIFFLAPFSQRDVDIDTYESSITNPRYSLPSIYALSTINPEELNNAARTKDRNRVSADRKKVHHTRIIHLADGLENSVIGPPRLEAVWNDFDDLEKLRGAGAEAYWQRANPGKQFDVDKEMPFAPGEEDAFDDEIEAYMHGMQRHFRTRGITTTEFRSEVANFDKNLDAVISLIAAGSEIPQRILMGSERGQLASDQDRKNWDSRVQDRRQEWAGPLIVRPFVDTCIRLEALPTPSQYDISWPTQHDMSAEEKAKLAVALAEANQKAGKVIFTPNEIRELTFELEPLDEAALDDAKQGAEDPQKPDNALVGLPMAARRYMSPKRLVWLKNKKQPITNRTARVTVDMKVVA